MGSGAGNFLKVLLRNFDVLAGYASIRAIESKSPIDDQQWLTYWVLYSLITLFELTFAKLLEWIPIWPYAKLIVTCWLVLPYFSGAAYVYEHYVRPIYVNPKTVNIWYVPRKKDIFGKPDDILTAAEKYIQENGTEAFENLIHRNCCEILLCFCIRLVVLTVPSLCRLINQEAVAVVIILCTTRLIECKHVVSVSIVDEGMHVHVAIFYYPVTIFGLVIYVLYNGYDTH
ncbi:HVA22-like protein a, partial [Mucuna pruriens]